MILLHLGVHRTGVDTLARQCDRAFVFGLGDGTVSHAQAAAFAMAVFFRDMTLVERVALTDHALAERVEHGGAGAK